MKTHTAAFKNNISNFGRELDVEISYIYNNETITLGNDDINIVNANVRSAILKSVMRELTIDSSIDIPIGTRIDVCQLGVKVRNDEVADYRDNYDYVNLGNYYVNKSEKQEDKNSYLITCYDKMINAMVDYNGITETFPMTVDNYINYLCRDINLTFKNYGESYTNASRVINEDVYVNAGYTYRDIFDELAGVTGSTICINEDDETLEIRYINDTNDTINEDYLKDININFGKVYGPVNTVILSRAGGADKISLSYPSSLSDNEKIAIEITDNQIMNFNDRDDYLAELLNRLKGLTYSENDFSSPGICYYNICDKYTISVDNVNYTCIMFNDEINITQGLTETIYTDMPETSVTDYKHTSKTDKTINKATIIAKKNEGEIEALTNRVTNVETETGNMYTKEQVDILVQNAETGVTNTFSEAGGNNILRNTNFSANDSLETGQIYEYWYGDVVRTTNNSSKNGYSILLQNNTLYQTQNVANGPYTLSFYYKVLNPLATVKVRINDKEYALTQTYATLFQTGLNNIDPINISTNTIRISFISDINDACEIYDIMLNSGTIKLAYSQNANEVITDTVNISRGITITSSTSEVKFTANNDGIRTKTLYGEEITTFTNTGMTTEKAIIKNQAQIVGILRQKVGDQVWDSLM